MSVGEHDKLKLMVVDDEPDNLDLLYRTFRREFQVFKASSGLEALTILEQVGEMAIIISDQRMPRMNGTEFLSRTVERFPDTIRIVLTGYTDVEDLVEAINSGKVFKYITKPWNPEALKNVVLQSIETYRLVKQRTRALTLALRRESLINAVMSTVRESLDYHSMLQTVVNTLGERFEADHVILRPQEDGCPKTETSPTAPTPIFQYPTPPTASDSHTEAAPDPLWPVLYSHHLKQESHIKFEAEATLTTIDHSHQPIAVLTLPLIFQQRCLAVTSLYQVRSPNWSEETLDLIRSVADQVALAIAQAQLYQQVQERTRQMRAELEVARQIQMNLLRQSWPSVPGAKIQARCLPANEVGGDFFEVLVHPQGDVWLAVGDVSGKGVPAALFMASAISVLRRELSQETSPAPDAVMRSLNSSLLDDLVSNNCFITLVLVRYSPTTRHMTYANAGHIYPLVWSRAVHTPQYLETRGVPLGILPIWQAKAGELDLSPGDTLLLASDGLTEVTPEQGAGSLAMLQQAGLWALLEQQPPPLDLDKLLEAIQKLSSQQDDDQTALSLEVLPDED
ncbi:MAG: SpoIIE family protein phosphatase [Cyanobacteria bacterium Co-bin8]|nr:SpoIIE family protein phosphatase [Cyanobacteria bacterium Co-bin8]